MTGEERAAVLLELEDAPREKIHDVDCHIAGGSNAK
jgi:hypothetical protein